LDRRQTDTSTTMRPPDGEDLGNFVPNGETKLDLENDCCSLDVNAMGLSDFQKLKKVKEEQRKRQWMIGFASGCLVLSLLLSLYCFYNVQQLFKTIKTMDQQLSKEEGLSFQNSVSLKLLDNGGLNTEERNLLPTMFDCTRTSRFQSRGIVNYDECLVDTTGGSMNITSGVFTASQSQAGIYQITFTAKYVANSNGRFGAWSDVFVNDVVIADSQREYNGCGGKSRTESSTHTVMALYPIRGDDTIRVQFNKDGHSYIHSDNDHDVHFTARKISDLPIGQLISPNNL